jgi:hypothetical protein
MNDKKVRFRLKATVFTEVTFWNSRNTEFYVKATLLLRNFPLFNSAEFLIIPGNFVLFYILNLRGKFIQEPLDFFVLKAEVEFRNIYFAYVYLNDPLCLKDAKLA